MELTEPYTRELFSLAVPLITWFLGNRLRDRAKLQLAFPHRFTFLVQDPKREENSEVNRQNQSVHTASQVLTNSGRDTATRIELVFNWKPLCVNAWPSRHHTEHLESDGRYVMIFESLAPGEQVGIELLSINGQLPNSVTARSDQCVAETVAMYPQPVLPKWKRKVFLMLLFLGSALAIYLTILLLQILLIQ